jgi:alpha/beta superfamily hydrolase
MKRFVMTLPEPRKLVVIPGSDHFFTGKTDALGAAISDWPGLGEGLI